MIYDLTGERGQNETCGTVFRPYKEVALRLHQAQLSGLEFHNVAINGVRSEDTQAVGDLLIDELATIEDFHDLLGLLRGLSNHLVLHRDHVVWLGRSEEGATEVDTMIKASGRESTG